MSLIKWEPFGDIDRFFEEGFPSFSITNIGRDLAVDVYEDGNKLVAEMNVPGIDPEHIDIHVEDNRVNGQEERS